MLNRDLLKNWIDKTKRAGFFGSGVYMGMVVVYAPLSTYTAQKILSNIINLSVYKGVLLFLYFVAGFNLFCPLAPATLPQTQLAPQNSIANEGTFKTPEWVLTF